MRNLSKLQEPELLSEKSAEWLAKYKEKKNNSYRRYRYRDSRIKSVLIEETDSKCVYCESKIGHNTPGDVEHKIPSSKIIDLHFAWDNLTIACTECNRRKNDFYENGSSFLDPYNDDVESMLIHQGPVVVWALGQTKAEIAIRTLEMNSANRSALFLRKVEKIEEVQNLTERYFSESDVVPKFPPLIGRVRPGFGPSGPGMQRG